MGGLADAQLQSVRDGFDGRVAALFEAQRGKPLVRAEKQRPLRKARETTRAITPTPSSSSRRDASS